MKTYDFRPDLIRVTALVLVVLIHSITLQAVYIYPGHMTVGYFFVLAAYYFAHCCVPLFLMLSGYLCGKKRPEGKYFGGIFRVLVPYALISLAVLLDARRHDGGLKVTTMAYRLLSFQAGSYDWYVEMYVGLFLLIPFLNVLYDHLSRTQRRVLLGVMLFLTAVPDVFASFGTAAVRADISTDYFRLCFPVTYYLLGRWVREEQDRLTVGKGAALFLTGLLIPLALCVYRTARDGAYRGAGTLSTFACLTTALCALGLMILLLRVPEAPKGIRLALREVSAVSFEAYLCSALCDKYLYRHLPFIPFPLMVPVVVIGAFLLGEIFHRVSGPIAHVLTGWYENALSALKKKTA